MILRVGSRGASVCDLQRRLNALGLGPLDEDGIFGSATATALRIFQEGNGLEADGICGPLTWAQLNEPPPRAQYPAVVLACERLGHSMHLDGQVNIIGVRSKNRQADSFDDEMHLAWVEDGLWHHRQYPCTTDPGLEYLEGANDRGTAILVPGQYAAYKFDLHQGRAGYSTLCQRAAEVSVYRDGTRDAQLDLNPDTITTGWYGINHHHAGSGEAARVGRASAGCQVYQRISDWMAAMSICRDREPVNGIFTYTLINEGDVT